MSRPSGNNHLPVFSQPTHEWINRVTRKAAQLGELQLTEAQRRDLWEQVDGEFSRSWAALSGLEAASANSARLFGAIREVRALVEEKGESASLSADLLLRLQGKARAGNGFRKTAARGSTGAAVVAPEHLPAAIRNACVWFRADSFAELNPVEQSALAFLRLIELGPFDDDNEQIAVVAASLFTMRKGLPPIVIGTEMFDRYRVAIEAGQAMNTSPMVELIADALAKTLDQLPALARESKTRT